MVLLIEISTVYYRQLIYSRHVYQLHQLVVITVIYLIVHLITTQTNLNVLTKLSLFACEASKNKHKKLDLQKSIKLPYKHAIKYYSLLREAFFQKLFFLVHKQHVYKFSLLKTMLYIHWHSNLSSMWHSSKCFNQLLKEGKQREIILINNHMAVKPLCD